MPDSRQKGARGEREWAGVLATRFPDLTFRRNVQSRGGGKEAADVTGLPGFHFEVKYQERLNIWAALEQATRDASPGVAPVVAFRRNYWPWTVAMDAGDWLDLVGPARFP